MRARAQPPLTEFDRLARYYDLEHADYQGDIALYTAFALAGGPILELACGTGRCLLPLAAAGHDVTGLDLSEEMLAIAREKVAGAGLTEHVHLQRGDIRTFDLGRRFSLIFIALNSLMHLPTQEDQRTALARAAGHLENDGRLVLDLFNPETALPDAGKEGQLFLHCLKLLPGGKHLLHFQSPSVDPGRQVISMANYYDEIDPDGAVKRWVAPFSLRYLTRAEIELLLPAAGLETEAIYGTYELDPFVSESPRLLVVARRASQDQPPAAR